MRSAPFQESSKDAQVDIAGPWAPGSSGEELIYVAGLDFIDGQIAPDGHRSREHILRAHDGRWGEPASLQEFKVFAGGLSEIGHQFTWQAERNSCALLPDVVQGLPLVSLA
jgi:hypothetical protein